MSIRVHHYAQRDGYGVCKYCGVVENKDAHGPRWCPGRPPSIATRRKCTGCVHDEHRGMCTGRNGGTAYPCPCIRTSVPEDAT